MNTPTMSKILSTSVSTVNPFVVFSKVRARQLLKRNIDCQKYQMRSLRYCLRRAANTKFGQEHGFSEIESYDDYRRAVPLRELQGFAPYWALALEGTPDVCWPGTPRLILSSGGTTSGKGYLIPVTAEGLRNTRRSALLAGLFYTAEAGSSRLFHGKQVILGGSWDGDEHPSGARIFKASGAGPASIPRVIRDRKVIPWGEAANEKDFNLKVDMIVEQALRSDVAQISSTPVWLIAFFERVGKACNLSPQQTLKDVWPGLEVVLYGGASLVPYKKIFKRWLGDDVAIWETYCASEGMISIRDSRWQEDTLVLTDMNAFFEFIPREEYGKSDPTRLPLWEVETDREYVIAMTNTNGLFSYVLGDTVKFTSVKPYRLVVSGRTKFYLNTVGEHITQETIERTLVEIQDEMEAAVVEYTVGPGDVSHESSVHHDWVLEFQTPPADPAAYSRQLDDTLAKHASDYGWYRKAGTIESPRVRIVPKGTFSRWVERYRNNDPQTKIPKVRNDRVMLDQLAELACAS